MILREFGSILRGICMSNVICADLHGLALFEFLYFLLLLICICLKNIYTELPCLNVYVFVSGMSCVGCRNK